MVRVNVIERYPDEEEIGQAPLDLQSDLIVEIVRKKGKKDLRITDLNEKIKEEDTLVTLSSGLVQNWHELSALGKMGKELDVELSMHTPYYMDLTSNNELTKKSIDSIHWSGMMTSQMEGKMVTTHIGLYGNLSKKAATERITDLKEEIEEDDNLITLASGLVQNYKELEALGKMGRELDVELSMHTPYYMDLTSNTELTRKSMDSIRWAGLMTNQMGGVTVTTHIGLYGKLSKRKAKEIVEENVKDVVSWWRQNKIKPQLGLEISGRQEVWGSLDEILELCDTVDGPVPVINFAHYHARENGLLRSAADFADLLERTK
ncbi:MAG: TIM barrel protein, partial [Methanomassiliicoccales archaeon]|nr:TIM barrel protein [Methanomassiliicoccales archaeon]